MVVDGNINRKIYENYLNRSGGGKVVNCNLINNGCGAWGIRKSTIGNIIRENNRDDKSVNLLYFDLIFSSKMNI